MLQVLSPNADMVVFPASGLRTPIAKRTNVQFSEPAVRQSVQTALENLGRRNSVPAAEPGPPNDGEGVGEYDDIFAVFTGAYSRGECSSEVMRERMRRFRARGRAVSSAGHKGMDGVACNLAPEDIIPSPSPSSFSLASSSSLSSQYERLFRETSERSRWFSSHPTPGQSQEYTHQCPSASASASFSSPAKCSPQRTYASALDREQYLLSLPPAALLKRSGWHARRRPCVHYATTSGHPDSDTDADADALAEAVELAKDLFVRVLLLTSDSSTPIPSLPPSGDIEASACPSPSATVPVPSSDPAGIFAPVLESLQTSTHPEPTACVLRYLVTACWDPVRVRTLLTCMRTRK